MAEVGRLTDRQIAHVVMRAARRMAGEHDEPHYDESAEYQDMTDDELGDALAALFGGKKG